MIGHSVVIRTMKSTVLTAAVALLIGSAFTLPASGTDFGRLDFDGEVESAFDGGRQLEGYRYYYSGMINSPDGIIGIREGYTLETTLWKEYDPERQVFRELVGQMRLSGGGLGRFIRGMRILDSRGEMIGVWFSELDRTTVRMRGERVVEIATPGRILDLRPDSGRNVIWGGR